MESQDLDVNFPMMIFYIEKIQISDINVVDVIF